MKYILQIFTAALLFTACSSDTDLETKKDVVVTDTSAMYNSNTSTDVAKTEEIAAPAQAAPVQTVTRTVYVTRNAPAKRVYVREAAPANQPVNTVPNTSGTQTNTGTQPSETNTQGTGNTGTTTTTPAPEEKDKGWSNSTKGAVIGGVGGAIGGAILSKNKGKGAIIGGVVGAAGGYILGRKKDKQEANR